MVVSGFYFFSLVFGLIAFLLLAFLPGYFVSLFVFPKKNEIRLLERGVISFAMSFSLLPFLLFVQTQFFGLKLSLLLAVFNALFLSIICLVLFLCRTKKIPLPSFFYSFFKPVEEKDAVGMIPKIF